MKKTFAHISVCLLLASILHMSFFAVANAADSVIRIIGDRGAKSQNNPAAPSAVEPTVNPVSGSTTIRIVSDKQNNTRSSSDVLSVRPAPPINEIHIVGDRVETIQKESPGQPVSIEVTKTADQQNKAVEEDHLSQKTPEQEMDERLAALKAENVRRAGETLERERLAKQKAEQEIKAKAEQKRAAAEAARLEELKREQELLAARKAEEERRNAEKLESERLAKLKAEQEKAVAEAARIAASQREQEQLAARKAEEERKAFEKADQERMDALKFEEERLADTRRTLLAAPLSELVTPEQQAADNRTPADSPTASARGGEAAENQAAGDNKTVGQAPETIWDLYLSARANDPALGRSNARVTGSLADSDQLFSTLMPHLDSSAGVQQISQALANYNTPNEVKYGYTSFNYSLIARMTLLNVPAIYSLSAADAGLRVEQAGVAAARQNLIIKFTDAYFALLKAQADKHIALGEIKRLKQVHDQSRAFFKEGTGDLISVYEAQSRLDGAGADLTKSESTLRLAEQKLSSVVGKPVKAIVNYLPQQPAKAEPDDLDWWVATMEKEQPLLRQAREGLVQSSEQRKSVKAEYLPVLQTSGGYTVSRGTPDLPSAEVRQWFVGASLSLPWYSGGETAAKVRRAVASEEERQHLFNETIEQQRENLKQAFYNLRYNFSLIKALEQKMTSAEIQLDAVKKGRSMGMRNAIDLLNAEQSYSLALRDYKYALYDNFIRVFQLKSAAGILADADVSDVSKKASPTLSSRLSFLSDINPN